MTSFRNCRFFELVKTLALYTVSWFLWAFWSLCGAGNSENAVVGLLLDTVFVKAGIWLLIPVLYMKAKRKRIFLKKEDLFAARFPWLACLILLCLTTVFLHTVRLLRGLIQTNAVFHWSMLITSLSAGVIEELSFRGYYFEAQRKQVGFWPAALLNGMLFTLFHYPELLFGQNFFQVLSIRGLLLFTMGVVFCWMFKRWRNIALNITVHSVWNILIFLFCLF